MIYKLVITKIEPNSAYDAEFAKEASLNRNFGYNGITERQENKIRLENHTTVLQVELTEEEYKQFKKAVLEII